MDRGCVEGSREASTRREEVTGWLIGAGALLVAAVAILWSLWRRERGLRLSATKAAEIEAKRANTEAEARRKAEAVRDVAQTQANEIHEQYEADRLRILGVWERTRVDTDRPGGLADAFAEVYGLGGKDSDGE